MTRNTIERVGIRTHTVASNTLLSLIVLFGGSQVSIALAKESASRTDELSKGKQIYGRHCAGCHGPQGKGDGYLLLGPEPANLTSPETKRKPDAALLDTIHEGKPNMPSWKIRLSDKDSRAVLAYIRTLSQQPNRGSRG